MSPESLAEAYVMEALGRIGLVLVAKNHVMHRPDGTIEGEVDLVYTLRNYTFVIEVSANTQDEARRIKRKKLREWHGGDLFARLSAGLGLPASNELRTVYVDMSWSVNPDEDIADFNGGAVLGSGHIEGLGAESPEMGQAMLLEWSTPWWRP